MKTISCVKGAEKRGQLFQSEKYVDQEIETLLERERESEQERERERKRAENKQEEQKKGKRK